MADLRSLVIVLGDQLDLEAAAFDGFNPALDAVWMAEVVEESTHVWSSKPRTALFLAAMRHFALALEDAGRPLHYTRLASRLDTRLDAVTNAGSLCAQLQADILWLKPGRLIMTEPGEWRVLQAIKSTAAAAGLPLDIREDRHFLVSVPEFAAYADGRKSLRMEYFYREQRKRYGVLMEEDAPDQPLGSQWNFDSDNREAFSAKGPGPVPARARFEPDEITRDVIVLVNTRFAQHPGKLDSFAWPVTRTEALHSLRSFVEDRLPLFGRYQDAMWPDDPWLYHAHISSALNLKLLNPREVIAAAEQAYCDGHAPRASVEGFIRQILGWREYVRGIYWTLMPGYVDRNHLNARQDLPAWYWTGETEMACLRDTLTQTLDHGYANHIQRLMVTGLYALLLGVQPQQVHQWYLAVYVDAVEWAELPNTLGMSQYADGGVMGSKPYIATGKYIQRMSPHCGNCRYDPGLKTGERACPFTTLYWDFLMRHEAMLSKNNRMSLQVRNLIRLSEQEKQAVKERAEVIRRGDVGVAKIQSDCEM